MRSACGPGDRRPGGQHAGGGLHADCRDKGKAQRGGRRQQGGCLAPFCRTVHLRRGGVGTPAARLPKVHCSLRLQDAAELVGQRIAELCLAKDISNVSFDRGGNIYHGRVKVRTAAHS